MTQWYVKDLSKLTDVSAQTLHHYDKIGLLKPSMRMDNGYRVYSEADLLQLQQIVALKFFGFSLAEIKSLLAGNVSAVEHFAAQVKFLEQQANTLLHTSNVLKNIISDVSDDKSIPWETVIKLIEVYHMTEKLEHPWVKEIFTPEELKQYVEFETELKANSTPEGKAAFEKSWRGLVDKINQNLKADPTSDIGIALGEECIQLINKLYGKKYAHLRTKKFEQGFAEGKGLDEVGLTPESVAWLEQAMDTYWRQRIYGILAQVGKIPSSSVLILWNEAMDDMYGDDAKRKKSLCEMAMQDSHVSPEAKKWLSALMS